MKQLVALILSAGLILGLAGCKNETPKPADQTPAAQSVTPAPAAMGKTGTVTETMDAGGYTYLQVDTGTEKVWVAAPQVAVKIGDPVVVPQGMAMENYHSKTLDRDFPVVYFVDSVMVGGAAATIAQAADETGTMATTTGAPKVIQSNVDLSGIEPADGGQTVAQVYADPDGLNGQKVKIRAKVVKFNADIMGKNWLHIQDGTGASGTNDLTVTTSASADIGDTVLVDGTLVTDKDFGYGYKYAVLIEDAKVTIE